MLIKSIKSLDYNSVMLEKTSSPAQDQILATVRASFVQSTSDVSQMNEVLENLRFRIVATYEKNTAQVFDFISQRFNEYLLHEVADHESLVSEPDYVRRMREDNTSMLPSAALKESQPISPFSTNLGVIGNIPQNGITSDGVPFGSVFYDAPLLSLLPMDEEGNVIRRAITGSTPGNEPIILQRVHLDPALFDLSALVTGALDQLTFYMFIYDISLMLRLEEMPFPKISLITGMTGCQVATVIGDRTVWRETLPNGITIPIGGIDNGRYRNTSVHDAPQAEIFQQINSLADANINTAVNSMFDRVYGRLSKTILDEKPWRKELVSDNNLFSEFWQTKDGDEDHRFAFAFDLESCLIRNSYFPFLYRSKNISEQIINSTGQMIGTDPSRVLSMNILRQKVSLDSIRSGNSLSTDNRDTRLTPHGTFPTEVVGEASVIPKVYTSWGPTPTTMGKIIFYEGKSNFTTRSEVKGVGTTRAHSHGIYKHSAEYVVYDAAPIYMRRLVRFFNDAKYKVSEIFSTIVNSVPTNSGYQGGIVTTGRDLYDPRTQRLNVPLNMIEVDFYGVRVTADVLLEGITVVYQAILDDLVPFVPGTNLREHFATEFARNQGLIDPLALQDLEKLIDVGTQIVYRKLTEIFPNDPMGRGLAMDQTSNLQRRGFCQRKVPLIRGQHAFSPTFIKGEDFGFGVDYVFERDQGNYSDKGLKRIGTGDYGVRINKEFEKYFQSADPNGRALMPTNTYLNPAYSYMSPIIVRVPERKTINQTSFGGQRGPQVKYDLDTYGQLFADIVNLKASIKDRQIDPLLADKNRNTSRNEVLYDSILQSLEEHYGTEIVPESRSEYTAPEKSSGDFGITVLRGAPSRSTRLINNGPLLFPAILGGANNTDPDVVNYFNISNWTFAPSAPGAKHPSQAHMKPATILKRPIKLPFAILGELTVDGDLNFSVNYEDLSFNSLKTLGRSLRVEYSDIKGIIEGPAGQNLPNQIKSAIILAATNQGESFGDPDNPFDACRPVLKDKDAGATERLISFSDDISNEPPFSVTNDPMKIYAKFLTFWMNYKNIAKIEYLHSFGDTNTSSDFYTDIQPMAQVDNITKSKTGLPRWEPLTPAAINTAATIGAKIMCRVRLIAPIEYLKLLRTNKELSSEQEDHLEEFFDRREALELPIYNQFFLLEPAPIKESPAPIGVVGTAEPATEDESSPEITGAAPASSGLYTLVDYQ